MIYLSMIPKYLIIIIFKNIITSELTNGNLKGNGISLFYVFRNLIKDFLSYPFLPVA